MGISGICDVVEFARDPLGVPLSGEDGVYLPCPVEYKRGKPKKDDSDRSQLIAQAMCLEEMLACQITVGYLFYDEIKHRVEIPITEADRERVRRTFEEMHGYYSRRYTPKSKSGSHCESCSMNMVCLPELMHRKSVFSYIESRLNE